MFDLKGSFSWVSKQSKRIVYSLNQDLIELNLRISKKFLFYWFQNRERSAKVRAEKEK